MTENLTENQKIPKKTALVSVVTPDFSDAEASFAELKELVLTAGGEPCLFFSQKRDSLHPKTCLGQGKLDEIKAECAAEGIEAIVFDLELTPVQQSFLEDFFQTSIFDRTTVILEIFAQRAVSYEGKLQVELARLNFMLPRLKGSYEGLSRLGGGGSGGAGARRGAGESKLALDKRHIRRRILLLKREIKQIQSRREEIRARRRKNGIVSVAIAGYTNSGKSTLLNALTDAGVLSKDMLFATLDPTSRRLTLPNGREVLLTDTVGFIRRLPHALIQAFHSTLEEVALADLVLLIGDLSDPDCAEQISVSEKILEEIGTLGEILHVYNKVDLIHANPVLPDGILISARDGLGLNELLERIQKKLFPQNRIVLLKIPYDRASLYYALKQKYKLLQDDPDEDGFTIKIEVNLADLAKYEAYRINA